MKHKEAPLSPPIGGKQEAHPQPLPSGGEKEVLPDGEDLGGAEENPGNVALTLSHNNIKVERNAIQLLFAKANDQICHLHFLDGETLLFSYNLKKLQQLLHLTGHFARVHRSYLIRLSEVIGHVYLKAKLSNGELIPLNAEGYELVKEELKNRKT